MSGKVRAGARGFVAKEGVGFSAQLTIRFHADELSRIDTLKLSHESRADYIRAALREKMLRDARER